MKRIFSINSDKSNIFHKAQDDQFRHLSLKQVIRDLRLSAAGDGECFRFHSSQGILGRLSTQLLIDQIDDGGSRFDFFQPQDHALNDYFSAHCWTENLL
jgi:hypothetical protein